MICDMLTHWRDYHWPNKRFEAGLRHLEGIDPGTPDGKYQIEGDDLYCMVQSYDTRTREGHVFEAHRKYADIQYLLRGEEIILWTPPEGLQVVTPYKPDAETYVMVPQATSIYLRQNIFTVFFPWDAHAPCVAVSEPAPVRKAVIKVLL